MNRFAIALIVIAAIFGLSSIYVIDETEKAIVTQFGEYRYAVNQPGLYFKWPFAQEVRRMDSRVIARDTMRDNYLTLDKKKLVADPITRWKVRDPLLFFKTVRDETGARRRLDDIVKSEMRREISSHDFGDIIGNARDPLMRQVANRVREKAQEYGIHVVDVRIKRADLPDEVQNSVFERMRAERDRVAKRYRSEGEEEAAKIRAETDKGVKIMLAQAYEKSQKLRGDGDAQSTSIYAAAYEKDPDFYGFVRSLEAYEQTVTKDTAVVLSTDSDLFQYLVDQKGR